MACEEGAGPRVFYHEPTPEDPRRAVAEIVSGIRAADLPGEPEGVGIGCPGPLDPWRGVVLSPPNLERWHGFPLAERLGAELAAPVRLDNDADAAALGEALFGAGLGRETVLYVTISTGIGAGIVKGGRIHRGAFGQAGEIWAHVPAGRGGLCINDLAGGRGMAAAAGVSDMRELIAAMVAGDGTALDIVERGREALAEALSLCLHLLAPDALVLGGGLCKDPSWFFEPVARAIRAGTAIYGIRDIPVCLAEHPDDAVLYGALALAGGEQLRDRKEETDDC